MPCAMTMKRISKPLPSSPICYGNTRQYIETDNDIGENRTGPEILRILKKVPKRHLRHVTTIIRDDDPRAGETLDILVGKTNNS